LKNSLKRQLNELITRIDFPMIVYIYETGRIIAQNNGAEHLIGHSVNNINKIWEEKSKKKLPPEVLNNGSLVLYQRFISNKKDRIVIDIEISSIVTGDEHIILALFEQSYKRPFRKNYRKRVPRLIWRDKYGKMVGYNTFLGKDVERSYIEKLYEEGLETGSEIGSVGEQYKQLLKTQESQFDLLQEVMIEGGELSFARSNRIALINKNGTTIGSFTIYSLLLEDEETHLFQDDIQRENNILKEAVSRSDFIAISWEKGADGVVDYVSPNIERWGYSRHEFYNEGLTFKHIIVDEDYPVFQYKNTVSESIAENSMVVEYHIRKKNGEIILIRDETIESTIKSSTKYKQGILTEITPVFLVTKDKKATEFLKKATEEKKIDALLSLYYQPIMSCDGKQCIGAEALLRWGNTKKEDISPLDVLSLSEYLGLIGDVSNFVLEEAFTMCKKKNDVSKEPFRIHVNLSVIEISKPDIIDKIIKIASKTKVNPALVVFEITQSLASEDFKVLKAVLTRLKELGFCVLLDNFGTGAYTLNAIMELPLNYIKIEESFIQTYGTDKFKPGLFVAIIELAHRLNIEIIVSGIETKKQMEFLFLSNVDFYQGYFFGYPVPKNEFLESEGRIL